MYDFFYGPSQVPADSMGLKCVRLNIGNLVFVERDES